MNTLRFKENKIVEKEGIFLPFVFVDMSVPAAIIVAQGTRMTSATISQNRRDKKNKLKKFQINELRYNILEKFQKLSFCNKENGLFESCLNDLEVSL